MANSINLPISNFMEIIYQRQIKLNSKATLKYKINVLILCLFFRKYFLREKRNYKKEYVSFHKKLIINNR